MKLFAIPALCLAGALIFAQDAADNRVHYACTAVTPQHFLKCQTTIGRGKELHLIAADTSYTSGADFARRAHVGDSWWPTGPDSVILTMAASTIRQDQRDFILTGNIEIQTAAMTYRADNAVYHSATGELESSGHVRVTPQPPPAQ